MLPTGPVILNVNYLWHKQWTLIYSEVQALQWGPSTGTKVSADRQTDTGPGTEAQGTAHVTASTTRIAWPTPDTKFSLNKLHQNKDLNVFVPSNTPKMSQSGQNGNIPMSPTPVLLKFWRSVLLLRTTQEQRIKSNQFTSKFYSGRFNYSIT